MILRVNKKTLSTSEKKEKERDGYVCIYKCGKHLFHSKYEHVWTEKKMNTSQMKEIVELLNYEIKEICSTNQDTRAYVDSCNKESERRAAYPEHSTVHSKNISNINVDNDSVIPQEEKNGGEKYLQVNIIIEENRIETIEQNTSN